MERTIVILKPDAVKRKLVGEIISRIEKKNFNITHMKMMTISRELAEEHYAHVKGKSFFNDMIDYICSGPVVVMAVEGEQVISVMRLMIGKTSVFESAPGTIRGDFGYHPYENLIHGSDSPESAEIEFKRFFPEEANK